MSEMPCPYCGSLVIRRSNATIYGRQYGNGQVWVCSRFPFCDSYVGCHPNGDPLGTLANAELRAVRLDAHKVFDALWNKRGWWRRDAYRWLARKLDIPEKECHIAMFDLDTCEKVKAICIQEGQKG